MILELFHFQCENNAEVTTMHSPAQKNALVQYKVFQKVHVVILKLGLNSDRATKDTHPTAAGCFHHKEIPPVCSCVLSQLHNPHESIQQATAQISKATNIGVSPFPLHSCTGSMQISRSLQGGCFPASQSFGWLLR